MALARKSLEPWVKDSVVYYDHQVEGVRELAKRKNFLLADDMGLGKSLQAITIFAVDVARKWAETCIVICPVTLKSNWFDEFNKFTRIPCTVLEGAPVKRAKQLSEFAETTGPRVLVVNYEQVAAHQTELQAMSFDVGIFDEAHYLKNPKAKRTKSCMALKFNRTFLLTGTPMLNQVNELWPLLHMISPREFPKYWTFVNRYCNTPDAPIWMADGSFKPLGKIQVGDKVMGWGIGENGRRTLCESTVEAVASRQASEIIEATMKSGHKVKCTPDHVWLSGNNNNGCEWVKIGGHKALRRGVLSRVIDQIPPLESLAPEIQHEAGWLGGIYDGEGSRYFIAQSASHNPGIYARICNALDMLRIPYSTTDSGVSLLGGRETWVKMLHYCRPTKSEWFDSRLMTQLNRHRDPVKSVRSLGPGEVVSMQTTTGNYVAWGYASKNCVFGGWEGKQIIGVKNEKELTEKLQTYMIRRLKADVLDLPEVQIIERRVDLLPQQRKIYDEVLNEMRLERHDSDKPDDIENALTKFLRLKQICGTTFAFTNEDHSAKLDLAIDDAIEMLSNGQKIVVFTQFRDVLERFCVRLDKAAPQYDIWELHGGIKQADRQPAVNEWSKAEKPGALVCMLQVAGVGLNMTAARSALFLDKLFVPGLNQQAIDRLHRIGQSTTQAVQIYEYLCRNTIESRVNQIIRTKKHIFENVVETDHGWKKKLMQALLEEDE